MRRKTSQYWPCGLKLDIVSSPTPANMLRPFHIKIGTKFFRFFPDKKFEIVQASIRQNGLPPNFISGFNVTIDRLLDIVMSKSWRLIKNRTFSCSNFADGLKYDNVLSILLFGFDY